jgi:REP element-mobilizing transposase RayT
MPGSRRGEWEHLLAVNGRSDAPRSRAQSIALREQRIKLEEYLDRGLGDCFLRNSQIATLVETALLHHHAHSFRMLAWTIMPNHVHALIEVGKVPLSRIIQNWKSIAAVEANKLLGRSGHFWQPEYWDRFMRDEEQKQKAIRYIENNPVKAKLCRAPEEWPFSSARFRDPQTRELNLPR